TQNAWHSALECRKEDPLGLNGIDIDIWESDSDLLSPDFDLFANGSTTTMTGLKSSYKDKPVVTAIADES
ncbi:hypothetical protein J7438_27260, partial [Thalassotalea sp. G20_0]|uniref:hypothetical protein n=1 Tax=Thalassotalea sp. G20_0 TaxID=2821093 RepID=UPI001ADC458E